MWAILMNGPKRMVLCAILGFPVLVGVFFSGRGRQRVSLKCVCHWEVASNGSQPDEGSPLSQPDEGSPKGVNRMRVHLFNGS